MLRDMTDYMLLPTQLTTFHDMRDVIGREVLGANFWEQGQTMASEAVCVILAMLC